MGGLSWQTTEESLRWHFEQYGPVVSVEVMRDRVTGDPRGFAFVVFRDATTVDLVMAEPNHEINHKIVDVKRAQARGVAPPSIHEGGAGGGPPGQDATSGGGGTHQQHRGGGRHQNQSNSEGLTPEQQGSKVFVGGIPPSVDRDELKAIFEEFGPVVDAIVMVDQVTNRSRCFGFVTFENGSDGAQRSIEKQPLNVQGRSVEVKLATPKAEQRRREPPSSGPKHVGLRAGMASISSSSSEYAGLAVAYGRSGWKAGYGTYAFGKAGWNVQGWEDLGKPPPERSGFSFSMVSSNNQHGGRGGNYSNEAPRDNNYDHHNSTMGPPKTKRARRQ